MDSIGNEKCAVPDAGTGRIHPIAPVLNKHLNIERKGDLPSPSDRSSLAPDRTSDGTNKRHRRPSAAHDRMPRRQCSAGMYIYNRKKEQKVSGCLEGAGRPPVHALSELLVHPARDDDAECAEGNDEHGADDLAGRYAVGEVARVCIPVTHSVSPSS